MDKRQLQKQLRFIQNYGTHPRGTGKSLAQSMMYGALTGEPESIIIAYRHKDGYLVRHHITKEKVTLVEGFIDTHDILITEKEFNKYRAQGAIICDYQRAFHHYFKAHLNKQMWYMEQAYKDQMNQPFITMGKETYLNSNLCKEVELPKDDHVDAMAYAMQSLLQVETGSKLKDPKRLAGIDLGLF